MSRYDLAGNPIPETMTGDDYRAPDATPGLAAAPDQPNPSADSLPAQGQAHEGYSPPGFAPPGFGQPLSGDAPTAFGQPVAPPPGHGLPAYPPPASAPPREPRSFPGATYGYAAPGFDSPYSGNDSGHNQTVPPEVAALRWNWGAFFLPPMWCASHGVPTLGYVYDLIAILFLLSPFLYGPTYGLLVFLSTAFVLFGIGIYLGARGNEIAWRNRAFDNGVTGFFQVQQGWLISGFAIALPLYTVLFCAFGYQVVKASRQEQALIDRAASGPATAPAPLATGYAPPQTFQPPPPTQTIIYGRPPGDYSRPNYADPASRMPGSPYAGLHLPNGAPIIIQRGPNPGAPVTSPYNPIAAPGAPQSPPGAPAPEPQPVSLPAAGQPTPPDQNAAPPAQAPQPTPPQQTAPEQNTAPAPDASQNPTPGLPPGQ